MAAMESFGDTLAVLTRMKSAGVVDDGVASGPPCCARPGWWTRTSWSRYARITLPMNPTDRQFAAKATWHRSQRALSPREKVRIVIQLQERAAANNTARASLGRPVVRITPWKTRP